MGIGLLIPVQSSFPAPFGVSKTTWIVIGIVLALSIIGLPMAIILWSIIITCSFSMEVKMCPVCDNKIAYPKERKAFTCYYCHRRILVKNNKLQTV